MALLHCRLQPSLWRPSPIRPAGPSSRAVRGGAKQRGERLRVQSLESYQVQLSGACYEDIIDQLAQRALAAVAALPPGGRRHVVGIAGAPGSGKSTLAAAVSRRVNQLASGAVAAEQPAGHSPPSALPSDVAVVLPMDGFHFYRRQLDEMADPQEARARRGAHWTFDALAFVRCVRNAQHASTLAVPSFDHGTGDPVEDDIQILPQHRLLLVEGNYVLLDRDPWFDLASSIFEDTWFVDVPLDDAMARVQARQVAVGRDPAVVAARIHSNDRPNGELVLTTRRRADVIVPSSVPFRDPR